MVDKVVRFCKEELELEAPKGEFNHNFQVSEKLIVSYENSIYKAEIIKTYPELFLIYIDLSLPKSKQLDYISNGMYLKYSIDKGEELYCYTSKIIGIKKEDRSMIIVLNNPEIQNRIEKRNHARIPLEIDVKYTIIPNKANAKQLELISNKIKNDINLITCRSLDISAGGLSMLTPYGYRTGEFTIMNICLNNNIYLLGKVVRSEPLKALKFKTAVQFVNLPEEKQSAINSFVVDKINKDNVYK